MLNGFGRPTRSQAVAKMPSTLRFFFGNRSSNIGVTVLHVRLGPLHVDGLSVFCGWPNPDISTVHELRASRKFNVSSREQALRTFRRSFGETSRGRTIPTA